MNAADASSRSGPSSLWAARQALPPLPYSHAEGSWIHLEDGRRLLDASSGLVCVNIGHAHPRAVEAFGRQVARCTFASPGALDPVLQEGFVTALAAALGRPDDRVLLTSSGTAAVEMAMLVAKTVQRSRGHPDKHRILTSTLSYHGNSAMTLGLSGHRRRRPHPRDGFGLAPTFDPPYPGLHRDCRFEHCRADCAEEIGRAIDDFGADQVAAVMIEPINGTTGGAYAPPDGYLAALREICTAREVFVVHDEVLTGLGRTGLPLAADHWPEARADLVVVSKGLGAGYLPVSAVLVDPVLAESQLAAHQPLPVMGTMSATPLQAAVGLAVLSVLQEIGAFSRSEVRGSGVADVLHRAADGSGVVRSVRGRGYFYGLELADGLQHEVLFQARRNGLLLYPFNGFRADGAGEGVIVAPPLTATDAEVTFLGEALADTFTYVAARRG